MFFEAIVFQLAIGLPFPLIDSDIHNLNYDGLTYYASIQFDEASSVIIPELEPFYLWGSYTNDQKLSLLGQRYGQNNQTAIGGGYELPLFKNSPNTKWFIELGWVFNDLSTKEKVQDEVNFTFLVDRHNVDESRPIPVTVNSPYDQDSYETKTTIDNNWILNFGIRHNITDHAGVHISYTYQKLPMKFEIYDVVQRNNGNGWWEEYADVDGSSINLGFFVEF
jgi:hypothetical protein